MINKTIHSTRKILVTAALPYANGPIHLGHILECVQADIWCRFQRLHGHDCLYLCADDAHGTPIMIAAEKRGISAEALIHESYQSHKCDLHDFLVEFDNFHTTHSKENQMLCETVFKRLVAHGDIEEKTISQAYDAVKGMFLPDRFIKGTCPKCYTPNQYGDSCEHCSAIYDPSQLIDPVSVLSQSTPVMKETTHFFFNLDRYQSVLSDWIHSNAVPPEVANKMQEWFSEGLKAWDITRDAPYFGFKIPDTTDKYFYVWLDAPIGYMASLKNLGLKNPTLNLEDYFNPNSSAELHHFIGKDIIYFHTLFWPALLLGAGFRLPTAIHVHGYLMINGEKMSKSRQTFITARHYLNHLNPEYLRYYFAAKLNDHVEDFDFNLKDFAERVNADLVGKYVNLASRCARFITKGFNGTLSTDLHDKKLYQQFIDSNEIIAQYYESTQYSKAVRAIMSLADRANQYIDYYKPWQLAKTNPHDPAIQQICTQGLNLFRILSLYLKPILPHTIQKVEAFLKVDPLLWQTIQEPLLNHEIETFTPLLTRVTPEDINHLIS